MKLNPFKITLMLFVCVALSRSIYAQKEYINAVAITTSGTDFPNINGYSNDFTPYLIDQFGIYYERNITRKLSIQAGYSFWNEIGPQNEVFYIPKEVFGSSYPWRFGNIIHRRHYKMVDAFFMYRVKLSRTQKLKFGVGLSYTWGTNFYLDSIPAPGLNGYINNYYEVETPKKGSYIGFVPTISYDHGLFNNRLSIGLDVRYRKYINLLPEQFDYGLHIGCNF